MVRHQDEGAVTAQMLLADNFEAAPRPKQTTNDQRHKGTHRINQHVGLARKIAKNGLRVLGDGKIDRALHVTAHYFTASAREKITTAGGTAEVITL